MTDKVRPKKQLGQHFLTHLPTAQKIVDALTGYGGYTQVLEVGAGMGVLTKFLLQKPEFKVSVAEIDQESVQYLQKNFVDLPILQGDFLKMDLTNFAPNFGVIGNFPYNISSQIVFKIIDNRTQIPEMVGMFQREMAQRIAEPPGTKTYGIISVLTQAFYEVEYLFTVSEGVFNPPPKVKSAVIRLKRKEIEPDCDLNLFRLVVKTAFNQRRKMLSNSLKVYMPDVPSKFLNERPEQLSLAQFVEIVKCISAAKAIQNA